jgi:hypothetical protein
MGMRSVRRYGGGGIKCQYLTTSTAALDSDENSL